jgi:hypothetical protein
LSLAGWDPNGRPRKPGIIGIGAQKAGTTWLAGMLAQHSAIWAPPVKEIQYFTHRFLPRHRDWLPWHFRTSRRNLERDLNRVGAGVSAELTAYLDNLTGGQMFSEDWYQAAFAPAAPDQMPLDVTPEYSTLPDEGVDEVARFLPDARFIYVIRHPVDRAISQLKMNLARTERRPGSLSEWLSEIRDPDLLDRGDYAAYLPRWQARIAPKRLLVIPFGRLRRDPLGLMREIERFLDLPSADYTGLQGKVFAAPAGLSVPDEARAALRAMLEPQFDFLARATSPDFMASLR